MVNFVVDARFVFIAKFGSSYVTFVLVFCCYLAVVFGLGFDCVRQLLEGNCKLTKIKKKRKLK